MQENIVKIELYLNPVEIEGLFAFAVGILFNDGIEEGNQAKTLTKKIHEATLKHVATEQIDAVLKSVNAMLEHPELNKAREMMGILASDAGDMLLGANPKEKAELEDLQEFAFEKRECQALEADEITKKTIKDVSFIKAQMDSTTNENSIELFSRFDQTSIGNLAYLSLHGPEPYNQKAERILLNFINYLLK